MMIGEQEESAAPKEEVITTGELTKHLTAKSTIENEVSPKRPNPSYEAPTSQVNIIHKDSLENLHRASPSPQTTEETKEYPSL